MADKKRSAHTFSNSEVAQLFENVAAAMTLKNGNRFKIIAYQNAQAAAEHATSEIKDLWEAGKLDDIPGFGESIRGHLDELFRTGKVKEFERLFAGIKPATFEFLKIPGVGPKTAEKLAEVGIKGLEDLEEKLHSHKLDNALSEKLRENLITGLTSHNTRKSKPQRMLLPYATNVAEEIMAYMRRSKAVLTIEPLGSLRRRVATIGDVDFAVSSYEPTAVVGHFIKNPQAARVISEGESKASVQLKIGVRADLLVQPPEFYGSMLQHFTGSKLHNIHLRKIAKAKGFSLSEKGIKEQEADGQFEMTASIKAKTEQEFYNALGMQNIPPEIREDAGEIEAAQKHAIPHLVELKDIKGDLHLHSSFPIEPSHDLGKDSMQAMVKHAHELHYQYSNFTEHNPGLGTHTEDQTIKLIEKKKQYIEQLKSSSTIKLLNSLEIDILQNGDLAVPEAGLKMLDLPIAGIHTVHAMPRDQITKRVVTALENPYLKILVHPTNRLLNKREESDIDWDVIFDTAKKHNKVLEINAYPDRLDLTDNLVREAVNRGIKMVISTDSHAVEHMDLMRYGVDVARRGWATKADIVNTWDWVDFAKFFKIEYK